MAKKKLGEYIRKGISPKPKKVVDYLIIDRSKWRTGGDLAHVNDNQTGKGYTALYNKQGFMCCLGFRCNQMGVPKNYC